MGLLKYKGYTGSVEYSDVDKCLYGKVQGMSKHVISYEGNSIEELENDFIEAINDYLEDCKTNNKEPQKPYSGQLNIRIPSKLHNQIAYISNKKGVSINATIKEALEKAF